MPHIAPAAASPVRDDCGGEALCPVCEKIISVGEDFLITRISDKILNRNAVMTGRLPHFSQCVEDQSDVSRTGDISCRHCRIDQRTVAIYDTGETENHGYLRLDSGDTLLSEPPAYLGETGVMHESLQFCVRNIAEILNITILSDPAHNLTVAEVSE